MATRWYSIRARGGEASAASAEVFIYGDIGESWWEETVSAKDFVRDIAALNVSALTVRINSFGGSVPDGIAIYNALKRHAATVTIAIDGVAMSIASLIAMAGDTVEMAENAMLMIHAPWSYVAGNAPELREAADMLDQYAAAMSTSYAAKTGRDQAEMLALVTDGKDHYFTAAEALAGGFIDSVVSAMPVAAHAAFASQLTRFKSLPAALRQAPAAAAAPSQEIQMDPKETPKAAGPEVAAPTAEQVLAADKARREQIRAAGIRFTNLPGVQDLVRQCEDDTACTVAQANEKLLAHLGSQATPVAGTHIVTVDDETDKARRGGVNALLVRAGVADAETIRANAGSPFRGLKLLDFARASLERAGVNTRGMDQMQIVANAFTQSTSDFPVLLENAMHKALLGAYATAQDTWTRFCATGSVTDFRAHNRYRIGSLGNLDSLNELGEFKNKAIPDGEKASVSIATKGNIINLSRQTVINDDLGAFVGLSQMLGRAARRSIEADVYALLASNSGMGPVLADGKTLFHVDHNNIAAVAGAPSVATFDSGRLAMASQRDVSGNDYLDIRPQLWLGPMGLGGDARVVNGAEYDPDTANKLQRPNKVRGLVSDIVDTPRLAGTAWYFFAAPSDAPVIEVDFLDGQQEPYLELQNGFDVDGGRYKVRLDYGVTGVDYRGAVRNAGA
ncbi:ClpP-like prohead protease/major capsid protein fusion protein [Niveibacterium sp. SC-1]|uniref:ClpP-like prohead protease/major capsid protein fusion protein n=1 Tax=Niveibacterium sp. SC-1 TaxID=3135646 RepID=UPI00311F4C1E